MIRETDYLNIWNEMLVEELAELMAAFRKTYENLSDEEFKALNTRMMES